MTLPQNKSPAEFEYYVNATSIEEACRALGDGVGTILAGGSDLWIQKDEGGKTFGPRLINISRVDELTEISISNDQVRLGARVTGDADAYRYLVESIRRFPDQAALADRMRVAGLDQVRVRNLSGGVAAIHSAWRI